MNIFTFNYPLIFFSEIQKESPGEFNRKLLAKYIIRDCHVRIAKLKWEMIICAQYGIKTCNVKVNRNEVELARKGMTTPMTTSQKLTKFFTPMVLIFNCNLPGSMERCHAPRKLVINNESVRSLCKWIPNKNVIRCA